MDRKTETLIELGRKDGAFHGRCGDRGGQKESLEEVAHKAQRGPDLFAEPWRSEAISCIFHAGLPADDVASDGSQAAAGVLDEGADHHVSAHVKGFSLFSELTITVVDHNDQIRLNPFDE